MCVCVQALLTRVAKTSEGAVELLRCGLVAQLMECQVYDMLPDSDAHRSGDGAHTHTCALGTQTTCMCPSAV